MLKRMGPACLVVTALLHGGEVRAAGPDVIVGDLHQTSHYTSGGAVNGLRAYAIGTVSCNIGTENLLWISNTNQHPVISQNMYRLKNGRFEQIGQSWLKHGFTALTENLCSPPPCNGVGGNRLGVGCSDPYSSGLNGQQSNLGPRYDVNATTGFFNYPFPTQGQSGNAIFKRLQVRDTDLDPALNAGALYFVEGHYVTPDDAAAGNGFNNASYRQITVNASRALTLTGTTQRQQAAINAWKNNDPNVFLKSALVPNDGLIFVGSKVTDVGGGWWEYEYAVQNLNSHRSVGEFSVPISPWVAVSNIGFHDVDYHSGEPFDGTDWPGTVDATAVRWATTPFATNSNANAIRWSTLYNFRFRADSPPTIDVVTLGLFRPGTPASVTVSAMTPLIPTCACLGDIDGDGERDGRDVTSFVNMYLGGSPADICADTAAPAGSPLDGADLEGFVNLLLDGLGCP
jgi:hypothetical protein